MVSKIMRIAVVTIATVALGALALGCGRRPPAGPVTAPPPAQPEKPKVALVMKTMTNPFFITMEEGAREAAERVGVELVVQTPTEETDIDKQIAIVEDLIGTGVKVLCIAPAGSKEIVPCLVEAKNAGVYVINLDNEVDPEAAEAAGLELDSYVGVDNEEGGYMSSTYLAELMGGKGKVAMLEGIPTVDNAEARKRGFERAMAEHPGIQIVASQTAHWKQEEALNVMADILQKHPDLDGLFCANDMMALGAIQAIEDAGKTGDIYVTAYDNLDAAQEEIRKGRLHATIEQHPNLMGKYGVEYAAELIQGGTIPKRKLVELKLITKETLEAGAETAEAAE
ncbi:MAG: substrate-binding domain-containing protein [Armatimonadota bacterium]